MEFGKVVEKGLIIITFILMFIMTIGSLGFSIGYKKGKKLKTDLYVEIQSENPEHKYTFLNKQLSDYICNLSDEVKIDSDLVVAILMVENPEFDPEITHKNDNGSVDCGLFQLNDKYLWTTFTTNYWVDEVELNPFNWKHNTYIAIHHLNYLQKKLKITDEVIMAYNCGIGAVMNGNVPASTRIYLSKVKNNLYLLKNGSVSQ